MYICFCWKVVFTRSIWFAGKKQKEKNQPNKKQTKNNAIYGITVDFNQLIRCWRVVTLTATKHLAMPCTITLHTRLIIEQSKTKKNFIATISFALTTQIKHTVYPKKYAHGFCFAVLCCGYTLTDFPISIRLTSLALWQSNDCPSASKATLMNMDKYFMWIHYERLHNHNKAKHNKTVCIFLGIYCSTLTLA